MTPRSEIMLLCIIIIGINVCSSAHNCGCLVSGSNAMAAIRVLYNCNKTLLLIINSNNNNINTKSSKV